MMKKMTAAVMFLSLIFVMSCGDDRNGPGKLDSPGLSAPGNNASEIATTAVLDWDEIELADNYVVQLSDDQEFSNIIINETLSESQYEVSGLESMTQYFWRVKATNSDSESDWSEVYSFTTEEVMVMALELVSAEETVSGSVFDDELVSHATIKNTSGKDVEVEVMMYMVDLYPGHEAAICTAICSPYQTGDEYKAPVNMNLNAGEDSGNDGFTGHLHPYTGDQSNAVSGTSTIKFKFINVDNPADTVSYTCEFVVS